MRMSPVAAAISALATTDAERFVAGDFEPLNCVYLFRVGTPETNKVMMVIGHVKATVAEAGNGRIAWSFQGEEECDGLVMLRS